MTRTVTRRVRASWLLDGTGAPPVPDALVVWDRDGRIRFAGAAADAPGEEHGREAGGVETLDATGCTVLPGLVDTHVHLTFAAAPGPPPADGGALAPRQSGPAVTEAQVGLIRGDGDGERAIRALAAAQAALAVGVTTLCDCGAKGRTTLDLRDLIAAGVTVGPRILSSGPPITTRAGHCWWLGGEADSTDEAVARVRELVKLGVDFVKVMATGGNLTRNSNPLEAQYPVETLAAIVADAHRLGRRVVAHAHGVEGIARSVEAGVDAVEHCSWQRSDGHAVDEAVAARMAAAGTVVGDTLAGFGAVLLREGAAPRDVPQQLRERYGRGAALREMGVAVVTNSDAMYPNRPFEDFPLGVAAASRYGGLDPAQAVHSATGLAARSIGLENEIGTLAAGRRADLLVVTGNAAANPEALARARWVLRDGVVVAADGRLTAAGVSGWRADAAGTA